MTPAQLATLKAAIIADVDAAVVAALATRNDTELARLYNLDSAKIVWKTSLPVVDYRDALVWTEVDTLTPGQARIWSWLTGDATLPLEPHKVAVRQGLADCWGAGTTTRTQLLAAAKRAATKAEALFATGVGNTGTPATLVFEGSVSIVDIGAAMNLA